MGNQVVIKKKHTGLKIFLWVLAIVIVLPVVLVYSLGFDTSGTAPVADESFNQDTMMNDIASSSLDNTKSTGKMDFTLSQDNLNQILLHSLKGQTSSIPGYEGAYLEITDSQYVFNLKIKPIAIFSTHLYLYSSLKATDTSYVFHIDDIKVGRLGGLTGIGMNVLSSLVSESSLTSALSSSGLSLKVSYAERSITYAKEDLAKDMLKFMGQSTDSLEGGAVYTLLDSSLLTLDFNHSKAISASLDLSSLAKNEAYSLPQSDATLGLDYSSYTSMLSSLLNDKTIALGDATAVYDYFMFGYDSLTEANKTLVSSLSGKDLSSIGITDLSSYQGLSKGSDLDLSAKMEELKAQVPSAIIGGTSSLGSITEKDLTSLCESMDLLGTNYLLIGGKEGAYKVNAIAVDDFYVNIKSDHLIITIGLSFNGYKTILIADLVDAKSSANDYKIELSFSSLKFGGMDIPLGEGNSLETGVYDSLKSNLSGISYISFSSSKEEMVMDFSSLATSSNLSSMLDAGGLTPKVELVGSDMASSGSIDFGIVKNS